MEEARDLDGARVIGAGVPIAIGGEEHRLFFGFEGLELIEDELGGLLHFTEALNGGYGSKRFKSVRVGLLAGLAHEGVTRKQVAALTAKLVGEGFAEMEAIHGAIVKAFDQAIPPPPADKKASKASGRGNGSRGPSSTEELSVKLESVPVSSAT